MQIEPLLLYYRPISWFWASPRGAPETWHLYFIASPLWLNQLNVAWAIVKFVSAVRIGWIEQHFFWFAWYEVASTEHATIIPPGHVCRGVSINFVAVFRKQFAWFEFIDFLRDGFLSRQQGPARSTAAPRNHPNRFYAYCIPCNRRGKEFVQSLASDLVICVSFETL